MEPTRLLAGFVCALTLIFFLVKKLRNRKPKEIPLIPIKTTVVLGAGGHCREMLTLLSKLDFQRKFCPVTFIIAKDDEMSSDKLKSSEFYESEKMKIRFISRSRKVGQSYVTSAFTTLLSFIESVNIVRESDCKLLLCNGPGTCIPPLLAIKLFCSQATIVYVESFCRSETLSLSGKIAYQLADHVLVQWPEMLEKYPRCKYLGLLV